MVRRRCLLNVVQLALLVMYAVLSGVGVHVHAMPGRRVESEGQQSAKQLSIELVTTPKGAGLCMHVGLPCSRSFSSACCNSSSQHQLQVLVPL